MNPLAPIDLSAVGAMRAALPELPAAPARLVSAQDLESLTAPTRPLAAGAGAGAGSFDALLKDFVQQVNTKQTAAADAVSGLLSGQGVPLHQAMIAMEEASVSFHLMVEVRNKLLESYQELMRIQV